jgi:hypothetical protein
MNLRLKHLRHKYSPAARRGREAAAKDSSRLEYDAWVAEQRRAWRQSMDAIASQQQ